MALLPFLASLLLAAGPTPQDEVHPFSVPNTRAASDLAALARSHLGAERWEEAIATLQRILEVHDGALLDAERPTAAVSAGGERSLPSQQDVYPGAADWARRQLAELPPQALELYRERYAQRSEAALERARDDYDSAALADLAERWPETNAAPHAWWSLGDLEFESGNLRAARFAWSRALRAELDEPALALRSIDDWRAILERHLGADDGERLAPGADARVRLAIESFDPLTPWRQSFADRDARTSEMRLTGPGEGARETPGADASSWPRPFPMPPQPFRPLADTLWHSVRSGDLVLFNTSRQLVAVNMWSGRERWSSGEPPGWEGMRSSERKEYERGLDHRDALFAPAVADGIVVAPLQVPFSPYRNEDYDNIPIMTIIPERRLFAWNVETGEELWSHDIPADWDGEAGDFAQRMRVAGPPVIAASRVLVPVYRLEGRIGLHVACYELGTGRLLWSQQVISGQRELNMFSRPGWAFSAPPVRVEGDRVVCLTGLGTIAALDLFTGKLLWETLYEQIPLPRRRSFQADRRNATWRNTPPVVANEVVVATPVDSRELVAVDLATGVMLWSWSQHAISRAAEGYQTDVDLLLGADDETIYLGGRHLVALRRAGGLRTGVPRPAWAFSDAKLEEETTSAWPVLTTDRVIVPTTTARLEVDRETGRLLADTPWTAAGKGGSGGNLLAVDGALFTLNDRHLAGYFEWDVLLQRAREEYRAAPESRETVRNLAALLAERGRDDQRAGYSESARSWLSEAVQLLSDFRVRSTGEADAELLAELHLALRSHAEVLADLADTRGALRSLETARTIAPDGRALRDTLLQEVTLLRGRDETAWLAALDRLEENSGDYQLRCAIETRGPNETPVRLVPLDALEDAEERDEQVVSVGLWAALERADHYASRFDVERELEELHHLLRSWPEAKTPWGPVRDVVEELIAERLSMHGREIYAPYDEAARVAYESALAEGDRDALESVPRLYPFAKASAEANDALLALALEDGDPAAVARTVLGELPERWNPAHATEREAHLALHLGVALAREGGESYLRGLLGRLALSVPRAISPFPEHQGRTLLELYDRLGPQPEPAASLEPTFGPDLRTRVRVPGEHEYLGELLPDIGEPATRRLLFARRHEGSSTFIALDASAPEELAWQQPQPDLRRHGSWDERVAFLPGAALLASQHAVRSLDADSGAVRWTWRPERGEVRSVHAARGLALVVSSHHDTGRYVSAVDGITGRLVWNRPLAPALFNPVPVVGEDELVFLPNVARRKGLVLDLYTGAERLELHFEQTLQNDAYLSAWIEEGLLLVPWFHQSREPERNQILAIDLDEGRREWRVSFEDVAGGGRELVRILRWDDRIFLALLEPGTRGGGRPEGVLIELHTSLGATAELSGYRFERRSFELGADEPRIDLESPYWFQVSPTAGDLLLHAVHLPFGHERWSARLRVSEDELYNGRVPAPVLSDDTAAVVVVTRDPAGSGSTGSEWRAMLYLFGRDDGTPRGNQVLTRYDRARSALGLYALGDALLVLEDGGLKVMR